MFDINLFFTPRSTELGAQRQTPLVHAPVRALPTAGRTTPYVGQIAEGHLHLHSLTMVATLPTKVGHPICRGG